VQAKQLTEIVSNPITHHGVTFSKT